MNLLSNKFFLVTTGLFLIVTLGTGWFFYPPVLKQYKDNRQSESQLSTDIEVATKDLAELKNLDKNATTIGQLRDQATLALPTRPDAALLLLQLDGLAKSLGLNATITVPFAEGSLSSQVAAPSSDSTVKAGSGSAGSSQPIVESTGSKTVFSLSGEFDYPSTMQLIAKLKTFIRWNKLTSVDIAFTGGKYSTTISGQVFWGQAGKSTFSGSTSDLLSKATTLFGGFQSYSTIPDTTKEGQFGKSNPFTP